MKNKEKLDIIYEDKYLIVVNKPYNLLTIATDSEQENTLYHKVYIYLKQKNKNNKVYIVHRLDKDTTGLVIFAKDFKIKRILQDNWDQVTRKYLAVLNGNLINNNGIIKSYLAITKTNLTYTTTSKKGKLAVTEYRKIMSNFKYTLVEINIKTGRKNQIRVHMKELGYPILGDRKYGLKDKEKKLYLDAYYLKLFHPKTKQILEFELDVKKEYIDKVK